MAMHTKRKTQSGTVIYSGRIQSDEYNYNLTGKQWIDAVEKMKRSVASVSEALDLIYLPIRRAKPLIKRVSEDPKDVEVADFVEHALFEGMNVTWSAALESWLEMLPFGFALSEIVAKKVEWNGQQKIAFDLFEIHQRTVDRWETEENEPGITQMTRTGFRSSLPMEDILLFTFRQKGDNYEGTSILRPAYLHWYNIYNMYKFEAIGVERANVGFPVLTYPKGATAEDKTDAENTVKNIRTHEQAYVAKPSDYTLEWANMNQEHTKDALPLIEHHADMINHATLTAFARVGSKSFGTKAATVDLSSMFLHSVEAIASQIADVVNKVIIKRLVDFNFANVKEYPKLEFTGIKRDDVEVLANALQKLERYVTPDPRTEAHVRQLINFPERDMSYVPPTPEMPTKPGVDDERPTALQNKESKDNREDVKGEGVDSVKKKASNSGVVTAVKRLPDESLDDCISRAIPMLKAEGMDQDQAIASAYSMCKLPPKKAEIDHSPTPKMANNEPKTEKRGTRLGGGVWFRPLTAAEEKVNFKSLEKRIDKGEASMNSKLGGISAQQVELLSQQVKMAIQSGDSIKALNQLSVALKQQYGTVMMDELRTVFEYAKLTAADEMKIKSPATTQEELDKLKLYSDTVTNDHAQKLLTTATTSATAAVIADRAIDETLQLMTTNLDNKSQQLIQDTSRIAIISSINQGRSFTQNNNGDNIYAYQYSAILDDRTCNTCLALDGKVIAPNDPAYKRLMPPRHFACRCIWVAIMNDEVDKPSIKGIPAGIPQDQDIGTFKAISNQELKQFVDETSYNESRS